MDQEPLPPASPSKVANSALDVEQLPVNLLFVAGELQVPLSELRKHGPGYVYNLDGRLAGQVQIRANGQLIGVGELVELNGRAGVRILECR